MRGKKHQTRVEFPNDISHLIKRSAGRGSEEDEESSYEEEEEEEEEEERRREQRGRGRSPGEEQEFGDRGAFS